MSKMNGEIRLHYCSEVRGQALGHQPALVLCVANCTDAFVMCAYLANPLSLVLAPGFFPPLLVTSNRDWLEVGC